MFNKKKKENIFYKAFYELAEFSRDAMAILSEEFMHFSPEKAYDIKEQVHVIEHKADIRKKEIEEVLAKEFITPIDREDIFALLKLIDDVTDAIEEISLKLYLYNYSELPHNTVKFTELTLECMKKMEECLKHFPDYLNKELFEPYVMEVVHLEEASDAEYIEDMHHLYLTETDGFKRHKAEAMYTMLEEVSDKCREVCRYVHNIALKNL